VLLASGSGTNVENIAHYFSGHRDVSIPMVLCNNSQAGVLERCKRLGIPAFTFNRHAYRQLDSLLALLDSANPDLIVLAGFLWKIPEAMVERYPGRIVNIHPALLPRHGGKGMYGMRVHEAVKEQGDRETGLSIHYVNEHYDQGALIRQFKVAVPEKATATDIAKLVHRLEMEQVPVVIESLLNEIP